MSFFSCLFEILTKENLGFRKTPAAIFVNIPLVAFGTWSGNMIYFIFMGFSKLQKLVERNSPRICNAFFYRASSDRFQLV